MPEAEYIAAFKQEGPFNTPGFEKALDLLVGLHEIGAFNKDMQVAGCRPGDGDVLPRGRGDAPDWLVAGVGVGQGTSPMKVSTTRSSTLR